MKKLFALLVGIEKYPPHVGSLRGCKNDVRSVLKFFTKYAEAQGLEFENSQMKALLDATATRQNIINSFNHFQQAEDGDICLFYYSGHGSYATAPNEFWYNASGQNESIVCYDSRMPDGRDLMDKELSYLIHQATKGKKLHFLAWMDCCHAGSATRGLQNVTERWTAPSHTPPKLEDYLGFGSYTTADNGEIAPPMGNHILLAASRDNETAKETALGEDAEHAVRGVFTYALLQELEQGGIFLSYAELMQRARLKVEELIEEQHPQLESVNVDFKTGFLGNEVKKELPYQISYDGKRQEWVLNAGSINNIAPSLPKFKTLLELEDEKVVSVASVQVNTATIKGMENYDKSKVWRAWLKQNSLTPIPIYLGNDLPESWKNELEKQVQPLPMVKISASAVACKYQVAKLGNALILTKDKNAIPVYQNIPVTIENLKQACREFLERLTKVASWERVLLHTNPVSSWIRNDLKIEFFKYQDAAYTLKNAAIYTGDDLNQVISLPYDFIGGKWKEPRFSVRISNNNFEEKIWVSALFLNSDFGISNAYLKKQQLPPKGELWMTFSRKGQIRKDFETNVPNEFLTWNINESYDFLKIYASSNELDTDSFNQKPLPLDVNRKLRETKGIGEPEELPMHNEENWMTKTIELKTIRPLKEALLSNQQPVKLRELTITAPAGFTGKISLTTLNHTLTQSPSITKTRKVFGEMPTTSPLPPAFWNTKHSHILPLTSSLNRSVGADVLEIIGAENRETINADNPLIVNLKEPLEAHEGVIPIGYDPDTQLYFPIGISEEDGTILLQQLPKDTPTGQRSLGGSIKIFFHKIIGKKTTEAKTYPLLRMVSINDDLEQVYEEWSQEEIAKKIAADDCQNIALFIHGVIGDTGEMPKLMQRVQFANNEVLGNKYQAVLTFDYENLNTSIDETARDLKRLLNDINLGQNHGKTLHIFAHSMGGLVSRWFIEKEGGKNVVNHLFTFGSPHNGSPFSDTFEMMSFVVTYGVNAIPLFQPWLLPLMIAGRLWKKSQTTMEQMKIGGEWLNRLNDGAVPPITYTLFVGSTKELKVSQQEKMNKILRLVLSRFGGRPHYKLLDTFFFGGEANDIAVSESSQQAISRDNEMVEVIEIDCNHLRYFEAESSVKMVRAYFAEKKDSIKI